MSIEVGEAMLGRGKKDNPFADLAKIKAHHQSYAQSSDGLPTLQKIQEQHKNIYESVKQLTNQLSDLNLFAKNKKNDGD